MERLLADASKIAGVEFNIDSYSDVVEAIHVMQEEMGIAGTTAEESASTISGSLNTLSSAWDNWLTSLAAGGIDVGEATRALVESLQNVAANALPAIGEMFHSLLALAIGDESADALIGRLEEIGGAIAETLGGAMERLQPVAEAMMPVLGGLANMVGGALSIAFGALGTAVSTVADALSWLWDNVLAPAGEYLSGTFGPAVEDMGEAFGNFGNTIMGACDALAGAWGGLKDAAATLFGEIGESIGTAVGNAADAVSTAFNAIKSVATNVFNAVRSVVQTVWTGISNAISTAVNAAKSVVTAATNAIKAAFNGIKSIVGGVKTAFNNIKKAITDPIDKAKELVSGAIDFIKSIFPVDLGKILNLKIPHINVDGGEPPWGIGGAGRLPSFNIVWKGAGGMVDGATLIGAGERGAELIWPSYEPYIGKYARAIADSMPDSGVTVNFTYNGREDASGAVKLLTANLRQLKATGAI